MSFTASPPQLLHWNDDASTWKEDCVLSSKVVEDTTTTKNSEMIETNSTARSVPIAFDVYSPKSNFKRAHPGIPDYHVSIRHATTSHTNERINSTPPRNCIGFRNGNNV